MGMDGEHITSIIVALIGLVGVLAGVFVGPKKGRRDPVRRERENQAVAYTESEQLSLHDGQAIQMAARAMKLTEDLSAKLTVAERRLADMEAELGIFKRSYIALYEWAQKIHHRWDEVRQSPYPLPMPTNIHHPD